MVQGSIEKLLREKQSISKLVKRYVVIAEAFERTGDIVMANGYFTTAFNLTRRIWAINCVLNQSQIIS